MPEKAQRVGGGKTPVCEEDIYTLVDSQVKGLEIFCNSLPPA
jgi:hypothetical protein